MIEFHSSGCPDKYGADSYEDPADEKPPLIKKGAHELVYSHYETATMFNGRRPKLIVWFRVASALDLFLPRYYNVRALVGKPGREGKYKTGWRTDLVREYTHLLGAPPRLDRIYWQRLEGCIVTGRVRTVETDFRQRSIPRDLRYSVIAELISVGR